MTNYTGNFNVYLLKSWTKSSSKGGSLHEQSVSCSWSHSDALGHVLSKSAHLVIQARNQLIGIEVGPSMGPFLVLVKFLEFS